jgi:NADPH:quinone reductase-like Zn-dependent oxidoreductase
MQAIVRTRAGFTLQRLAHPTPGAHEVLIRVHAATVTAGDVVLDTIPAFARPLMRLAGFPWKRTPGHELAGVVEAVGEGVERFAVGDRVFGTTTGLPVGANAEVVVLPEQWPKGVLIAIPDGVDFEQAAALPVGAMTAHDLLRRAEVAPGQRVLVYGASGSVGSYAVQLAKHLGAEVTGVSSGRNADMLRTLGADHTLDYTAEPIAERPERYHVVFDAVGKGPGKALRTLLTDGGTFLTIRSSTQESPDALAHLADLLATGALRPYIDRRFPLSNVAEAHRYVKTARKRGNIIITT